MNHEEMVKNHADKLIEKLIMELVSQERVDVRFEFEDNEQWSLVTVHMDDEDSEMSLRLNSSGNYELNFGYYDKKDDFHEITRPLNETEVNQVPKALQKVLAKVLNDEEGIRVPGVFLSK